MKVLGYVVHDTGLTVITPEQSYNLPSTHPNFNQIFDILNQEWGVDSEDLDIDNLISIPAAINTFTKGKVVVNHETGEVTYNGTPVHGAVVVHLIDLLDNGSNALEAWTLFLEHLMANPSYRSREQLYGFMQANDITINNKGELLLYKKVRDDYFDVYTGRTFQYTVGSTVSMDRPLVDDDPNRTCSSGLHVAAHSYISSFGGQRVIICAVNPADVVSIPTDYNNAKMRVSKLRVVAEHKEAMTKPTLTKGYMHDNTVADDAEW